MPIKRYPSATDLKAARIKTGTYTGDGSEGLSITGIGFTPKILYIFNHPVAEGATFQVFKIDTSWGDFAVYEIGTGLSYVDNRLNSLDADGFTVDDDGSDQHPNKSGQVYDYIAIG